MTDVCISSRMLFSLILGKMQFFEFPVVTLYLQLYIMFIKKWKKQHYLIQVCRNK